MKLNRALRVLSERTYDNMRDISQKNKQRRTQVTDLYGVEYSHFGGTGSPAEFYISVSQDLIYWERFQFKLYIEAVNGSTPTNFRVWVRGVDVTPYLMAQQDGEWFTGPGLYPNDEPPEEEDDGTPPNAYDMLDVASMMVAEGDKNTADKILSPDFKKIAVSGTGDFQATIIAYVKYSHVNR